MEKESLKQTEIFHPQKEVRKILKAPSSERRQKLEEFKEKLAEKMRVLSAMQEEFVSKVRENPDVDVFELSEWIEDFSKKYGLTGEEKGIAERAVRTYNFKHSQVRKIREKHPDAADLFKTLFGREPSGKVEVIEGPVTLYFRFFDIKDCAKVYSENFGDENPSPEEITKTKKTGGFLIPSSLIPALDGCLMAENTYLLIKDSEGADLNKNTYNHEEEHAIQHIFHGLFRYEALYYIRDSLVPILKSIPPKKSKFAGTVLDAQFKLLRNLRANDAKGEIFSHTKDLNFSLSKIDSLAKWITNDEFYDYFDFERRGMIDNLASELGEEYRPGLNKLALKHFNLQGTWREDVKKGLKAVWDLKNVLGYSMEEAEAILISEPLSKWPRVVKRLQEEQQKKLERLEEAEKHKNF